MFAALVVAFGAAIPSTFLSIGNLSNILGSQAVLFILVMAVLLPTVMGDFVDLSLGSSLGLSAMTLAVLNVQHHTPVVLACLAGIGAALVVGLFNVFFVVYFDNDPFIVTLGTMTIVQGIIYIISGNNNVGIVSTNLSNWIFSNNFLSISSGSGPPYACHSRDRSCWPALRLRAAGPSGPGRRQKQICGALRATHRRSPARRVF